MTDFTAIPNGIKECQSLLPDTLFIMLIHLYGNTDSWTVSQAGLVKLTGKSKAGICHYFQLLIEHKVLTECGIKWFSKYRPTKLYKFNPELVQKLVQELIQKYVQPDALN